MSREVVFVAGSPSLPSRSSYVADVVAEHARGAGLAVRPFALRDFEPADVLLARVQAPAVAAFVEAVRGSAAIVLSTPVYKASLAGGLKALIDLVPPDALVDRPALGIATAKLAVHGEDAGRAYKALFGFFRATAKEPLVVLDEELSLAGGGDGRLSPGATERVAAAALALITAVERRVQGLRSGSAGP